MSDRTPKPAPLPGESGTSQRTPPSAAAGASQAVADAERAIDRLRENIDSVDTVLVKLLNQRARWALEIGEVKKTVGIPVYQPDREAKVLGRVLERNRGPLPADSVRRLFERIIDENRRLERLGGQGAAATPEEAAGEGGSEPQSRSGPASASGSREGSA